jgi:hypothetical protein
MRRHVTGWRCRGVADGVAGRRCAPRFRGSLPEHRSLRYSPGRVGRRRACGSVARTQPRDNHSAQACAGRWPRFARRLMPPARLGRRAQRGEGVRPISALGGSLHPAGDMVCLSAMPRHLRNEALSCQVARRPRGRVNHDAGRFGSHPRRGRALGPSQARPHPHRHHPVPTASVGDKQFPAVHRLGDESLSV